MVSLEFGVSLIAVDDDVPAQVFGPVQGGIRLPEQLGRLDRVVAADADGASHLEGEPFPVDRGNDGSSDPGGDRCGVATPGQDHELVTTDAGHDVVVADAGLEAAGNSEENVVAGTVTV